MTEDDQFDDEMSWWELEDKTSWWELNRNDKLVIYGAVLMISLTSFYFLFQIIRFLFRTL